MMKPLPSDRRRWCVALGLALALPGATVVSCAAGTGGEPVELELAFERVAGEQTVDRFETLTGWTVHLSEARIALGAVYLNENPSLLARARDAVGESLIPSAHAHPGHGFFAGGEVRGEWLGQIAFDGLSTQPTVIAPIPGVAGPVASFTVLLDPPRADIADEVGGAHAWVVGQAEKDGIAIAFEGGLQIDEDVGGRLDGVTLEGELSEGARVVVRVDLDPWFDEADFERLRDEDGACLQESNAGRCVIEEGNQVHTAWLLGVRSARAISGTIQRRENTL